MSYGTAEQRKARRQEEAAERQARHDSLEHKAKVAKALGRGHKKTREYVRLTKRIEGGNG
jgi:hypothetical protein